MTTIVVGHPEVVQGTACSDPNNPYVHKLLEAKAAHAQKEYEREQQKVREYEQDLDNIVKALDWAFERNQIDNDMITLKLRLRQLNIYNVKDAMPKLNDKLAPKRIKITDIFKVDELFSDEGMVCVCTSVFCCCVPLLYWLPKFWMDEKFGQVCELKFRFEC